MKMKHPMRVAAMTLLVAVLAGCANGKFQSNVLLDAALSRVGLGGKAAAAAAAPAGEPKGPPLIAGYKEIRVAVPFDSDRGLSKFYVSPDGVSIAMLNGFVTRVVGIGVDLQGAFLDANGIYLGDFVAAARAGGEGERIAEYWEKGRIRRDNYRCTLAIAALEGGKEVIDETCKRYFGEDSFTNRYWVENDSIVCSRQWFHPKGDVMQFFTTAEQAVSIDLRTGNC